MHFAMIARVLGLLMMVFSFTMLTPVLISWWFQDGNYGPFFISFGLTLALGVLIWAPFMRARSELQTRDGFLVVTLFWTVLGVVGALPILLTLDISFTDAVFESVSGLTTTGASVLTGLDEMPKSLLYYRQQLHWLGGMGVIVLAVAILPILGVGGMQLYRAETPGPMKEAKLTPRIAETAKALWYVYLSMTVICAMAYHWAGMDWFDAICHSFTTVATGGFSTHDESMAYFDSMAVDFVGAFFMMLSGCSFALLYAAWRRRNIMVFFLDPEFRFYFGLMFFYVTLVAVGLWIFHVDDSPLEVFRHAFFQVASFTTGTGLTSHSAADWPSYLPYVLVFTSFIGGCAGSTGGGMKVVRAALIFQHSLRELRQLIYPHGVFALRFGRRPVADSVLQAVWGFVGVYITLAVIITLMLTATGMDLTTATSTTAASLNNLGVGIAGVTEGFGAITDAAKWIMSAAMLLGRLEVFTILVLFTRMFWRQ